MAEPTVTITQEEYEDLLDQSERYGALLDAGVDNWQGFDEAMQAYHKQKEQQLAFNPEAAAKKFFEMWDNFCKENPSLPEYRDMAQQAEYYNIMSICAKELNIDRCDLDQAVTQYEFEHMDEYTFGSDTVL